MNDIIVVSFSEKTEIKKFFLKEKKLDDRLPPSCSVV